MTTHAMILEMAIVGALSDIDLEAVAEEFGVEPATDANGAPMAVNEVATLEGAGFMTSNRGVVVRLDDGTELTVTINVNR